MQKFKTHFINLLSNIPLIVSGSAFALLFITTMFGVVGAIVTIIALIVAAFFISNPFRFWRDNFSLLSTLLSVAVLAVSGFSFCALMESNIESKIIAEIFGINPDTAVWLICLICCVTAFYFTSLIFEGAISQRDWVAESLKCRPHRKDTSKTMDRIVWSLALVGATLAFVQSFNGYIWADEAYSLRIVQYSYKEIIDMCAGDVHPPFYYMALKLVEDGIKLFTDSYFATVVVGKLFSFLPYILLSLLCMRKLSHKKEARPFVLLCIFGAPQLISYAVEIRMYSWALLFITASFLYARDVILNDKDIKAWILLVVFSVLSAYTHTFALVAMAAVWLCLLIWLFIYKRKAVLKCIGFASIVAVSFLPWLLVLIKQLGYVSEGYWIEPITWYGALSFFEFPFAGIMIFVPVIVFADILTQKRITLKALFEDGFGILVPVITILMGVAVSVVVRPVFISRYIIPCLMCLWISVFLLREKIGKAAKTVTVVILLLSTLSSYISFGIFEAVNASLAKDNISLVESFEDDAVVVVSCNTLVSDVVASYTDHMVYNWRGSDPTTQTTKYHEAFRNKVNFNDEAQIYEWVERGTPVYYFEVSSMGENYYIPHENEVWSMEYIGEYSFQEFTKVYKIRMSEGS